MNKLQKKFGTKKIRSVFLVKTDPIKFVQDIKKTRGSGTTEETEDFSSMSDEELRKIAGV